MDQRILDLIKQKISQNTINAKYYEVLAHLINIAAVFLEDKYQPEKVYSVGNINIDIDPPIYILKTILKLILYNEKDIWNQVRFVFDQKNQKKDIQLLILIAEFNQERHLIVGVMPKGDLANISFEANFLKLRKSDILDYMVDYNKERLYNPRVIDNSKEFSYKEIFG